MFHNSSTGVEIKNGNINKSNKWWLLNPKYTYIDIDSVSYLCASVKSYL